MLLESLLAILGLVGFGRVLLLSAFPVVLAGFLLLLFLFLIALFTRSRFIWAIFFLTATVEALYIFLKGSFRITLMLIFVVNILGLVAVFMGRTPRKREKPKVEVIKDEKKTAKEEKKARKKK